MQKTIYYTNGRNTICLLIEERQVVARGISIMSSMDDIFDAEAGRKIAVRRAKEAFGRAYNCSEILLDAPRSTPVDFVNLSLTTDLYGNWKGYYMPALIPTEQKILENKRIQKFLASNAKSYVFSFGETETPKVSRIRINFAWPCNPAY